jgi:uncharacterized protein YggU (UPF0235/DUF167 family)
LNLPAIKPLALSLRRSRDGVTITVRLTPKSNRDEVAGVEDHAGECVLKARVRALPEAGRANAALETLIALAWASVVHRHRRPWRQVALEASRTERRLRRAHPPDCSARCRVTYPKVICHAREGGHPVADSTANFCTSVSIGSPGLAGR